eukprot:TRINITY_DN17440_c0_g2_i1.p1 TRINITY_DN17440_c0_g2~~TRINITY_DN17440_c0_g2_i1.p1  ORF type:complete len:497 (-),score=95.10 TRINITY_DN17440_c0_g2_i1:403-1893(-)
MTKTAGAKPPDPEAGTEAHAPTPSQGRGKKRDRSPAKLSVSTFSFNGPRQTPTSSITVKNNKLKFVKNPLYKKALYTRGPRAGEAPERPEEAAPAPSEDGKQRKKRRTVPESLRIDPPEHSFYSAKGIRLLQPPVLPDDTRKTFLGPQSPNHEGKLTVVLDMDETLLHSSFVNLESPPSADTREHDFGFLIENPEGQELPMWYREVRVWKRARVDQFLEQLAEFAEIVVFTASQPEYANPLLDVIDYNHIISHRLCRDQCTNTDIGYIKDLSLLGRPLSRVVILDNSPTSFKFHADNGIPISSFYGDKTGAGAKEDLELMKILPVLKQMANIQDVRPFLRQRYRMHYTLGNPRTPAITAIDPLEAPGRLDIGAGTNAADDLRVFQDDSTGSDEDTDALRAVNTSAATITSLDGSTLTVGSLNDSLLSTASSGEGNPSTPGSAILSPHGTTPHSILHSSSSDTTTAATDGDGDSKKTRGKLTVLRMATRAKNDNGSS